ncbi:MAG: hypothetical protein C4341_07190 [Armatimonadota bacterium]
MTDRAHTGIEEGWRRIMEILGEALAQDSLDEGSRRLSLALIQNPSDPWLRLARGVLYTCTGYFARADDDFSFVEVRSNSPWLEAFAQSLRAELEDWQLAIITSLLREDRTFLWEYRADANAALSKKGFQLSAPGRQMVVYIERSLPRGFMPAGIS